ncbi:MAG: hemolysin III family protein [Gemmatimonadetes bacterium]|nr:hemolysin III family protein [Gemmatimonadota bacterium]
MSELQVRTDEWANTLTHAGGVAASALGGAMLIVMAALRGTAWDVVGVSIFTGALLALYGASTAYHATRRPQVRRHLKVLDHCAIYLLIAGTYTPVMIGRLRGGWGWSLFGVIWGLAVAGIVFKLFFTGRFRLVSTGIYVAMGWLVLIAVGPMLSRLGTATLLWLLAGGIAYTAGTPFYHAVRLRYSHAVWHLFVLAGSICHAIAVATAL